MPTPVAPPLTLQIQRDALEKPLPGDILLVERRFAGAVWDVRADLQRLLTTGVSPGDDDMQRLLVLFSWALERVPEGESLGLAATATKIRAVAKQMLAASPPGSPPVREAFGAGLREGVSALLAVAEGPYGENAAVMASAEDLRSTYDPKGQTTPPVQYAGMLEVMRKVQFLLEAILEARRGAAAR